MLPPTDVEPGAVKADPILVVENVTKHFGGIVAVNVSHLEVPRGGITALIGPNGAGKTTLFNLLTGFDRPDSGTWKFDDHEIAHMPAFRVARRGMVRTFQLTKALGLLTVLDNMRLGARDQGGESITHAIFSGLWRRREREITEQARTILARFSLESKADDYAASLSGGQRKLLEMARALMSEPRLVMLDEPMAGVNPALTQSLLGHIVQLKELGMTVLFVEHDMHVVRTIADWVIVMAEGEIVAEGTPTAVMKNPAVIDAYLGAHHNIDLGSLSGQLEVAAEAHSPLTSQISAAIATEHAAEIAGHAKTPPDAAGDVERRSR